MIFIDIKYCSYDLLESYNSAEISAHDPFRLLYPEVAHQSMLRTTNPDALPDFMGSWSILLKQFEKKKKASGGWEFFLGLVDPSRNRLASTEYFANCFSRIEF